MARLFAAGNHSSPMVMEPPPLSLSDSKTILAHLNPPASALDALPLPLLPLPPQLQLSTTDVFEAMQSLDPKSSHGWTGWTFHVMKSLFLTDYSEVHNLKSSALACITVLFNAILLGYPPSDLWLVSRAVLIPKEKGGYRPLGIGESWYRCISRAIMRIVGAPTGLLLHPTQLGVGTPSGCEIAGRIPQMLLDSRPDSCAILLDLENAFNRMRRGLIWNALLDMLPNLASFFRWAYGGPSDLRNSSGIIVGSSSTGVRQGDPLSSLFFALGMHLPLCEIRAFLFHISGTPTLVERSDSFCGTILAYIDDTTVICPTFHAAAVLAECVRIFARFHLRVNITKSTILGLMTDSIPSLGLTIVSHLTPPHLRGATILGVPTGSVEYRLRSIASLIGSMASPMSVLHLLSPTVALFLLKTCLNARPTYLARVLDPPLSASALHSFDATVDSALARILGLTLNSSPLHPPELRIPVLALPLLRSLPGSTGGLGIPRVGGLRAEVACLHSRHVTRAFILDNHMDGASLVQPDSMYWPPILVGRAAYPECQLFPPGFTHYAHEPGRSTHDILELSHPPSPTVPTNTGIR